MDRRSELREPGEAISRPRLRARLAQSRPKPLGATQIIVSVPIIALGGLASYLGFVDGLIDPISLGSRALGLMYLFAGVLTLAAAVGVLRTKPETQARASCLGGALSAYIALSVGFRMLHHDPPRAYIFIAIGLLCLVILVSGLRALDPEASVGAAQKVIGGSIAAVIAVGQLWYTAIYQPDSATTGLKVTLSVGRQSINRLGVELVPVAITLRNDSSYQIVIVAAAAQFTPERFTRTGSAVRVATRAFSAWRFVPTPYYLPPNSALTDSVVEAIPNTRAQAFNVTPYLAYARTSRPGFTNLRLSPTATQLLQAHLATSGLQHCDPSYASVHKLQESAIQRFTNGQKALVTDTCTGPNTEFRVVARLVPNTPRAIRTLDGPPIASEEQSQAFLAQLEQDGMPTQARRNTAHRGR